MLGRNPVIQRGAEQHQLFPRHRRPRPVAHGKCLPVPVVTPGHTRRQHIFARTPQLRFKDSLTA
jgi:hypothetical protein